MLGVSIAEAAGGYGDNSLIIAIPWIYLVTVPHL